MGQLFFILWKKSLNRPRWQIRACDEGISSARNGPGWPKTRLRVLRISIGHGCPGVAKATDGRERLVANAPRTALHASPGTPHFYVANAPRTALPKDGMS